MNNDYVCPTVVFECKSIRISIDCSCSFFSEPTIELDIFERFCHRVHGVGAEIEGKAQNSFFYIVSVIVELP